MKKLLTIFTVIILSFSAFGEIQEHDVSGQIFTLEDFDVSLYSVEPENSRLDYITALEGSGTQSLSRITASNPEKYYWVVFQLVNRGTEQVDRYIRIDEYGAETANLHIVKGGDLSIQYNGMEIPIGSRLVKSRHPVFSLTLTPGEKAMLYLEYRSRFITPSGIHIEDPESYRYGESRNAAGYLFFFGAALAILFYNIFLTISLRDRTYLYYILFVFFFVIFVVLNSGYSSYFFSIPTIHYILTVSVSLVFLFLVLFTGELLQTRELFTGAHKVLKVMTILFIAGAVLVLINIKSAIIIGLIGMPASLILLIIGILGMRKKIPLAPYYVLAIGAYLIGVFCLIGLNLRILPYNDFTRYFYLLGSLIEMVTFSLALGYRFKLIQEEKLSIQNKLYDSERQNREELEVIVQERTRELMLANKELERMTVVDGLTGLYNRRFFDSQLINEWNRLQRNRLPMSLIMCDIDHFKRLNDSLGHQAGDDCIRDVSKIIGHCVKRDSDIAARYGGEEFAIILPGTDSEGAYEIASCIQQSLEKAAIPHPSVESGMVSISFGIATQIPTQPPGSQALVASADKALYQSKKKGRNRITVV